MPTRNVVLTNHQQALIETLMESGRYQNASEIMREGLRLVEQRESEDSAKLEALRAAAREGAAAFDRGDFKAFADMDGMISYLTEITDRAISRRTSLPKASSRRDDPPGASPTITVIPAVAERSGAESRDPGDWARRPPRKTARPAP